VHVITLVVGGGAAWPTPSGHGVPAVVPTYFNFFNFKILIIFK
jgi:hypothetical protein